MPQKIDVQGIFLDPEQITDLYLQKRIAVYYPIFKEVETAKSVFGRFGVAKQHTLQFEKHEPYGIILAEAERPDPSSYIVDYREALVDRLFRGFGKAGKNIMGHINEALKIEVAGDRQYRILQSGRQIKTTSIRDIPAKVRLLSGQVVDVFKSSPNFDFQGGTPYATTDIPATALMIVTGDKVNVLFGAGVDASDDDVKTTYSQLAIIYNEIQARHDEELQERKRRPLIQMPKVKIQMPKVNLPKIEMPAIRFQSPFVIKKKDEEPITADKSEEMQTESDAPTN